MHSSSSIVNYHLGDALKVFCIAYQLKCNFSGLSLSLRFDLNFRSMPMQEWRNGFSVTSKENSLEYLALFVLLLLSPLIEIYIFRFFCADLFNSLFYFLFRDRIQIPSIWEQQYGMHQWFLPSIWYILALMKSEVFPSIFIKRTQ